MDDEEQQAILLQMALKGKREYEWCLKCNNDFDRVMKRIGHWMRHRDAWVEVTAKISRCERLSADFEQHMRYFKLIAMHMHMKKGASRTKELFIKSLGPEIIRPAEAKREGRYKELLSLSFCFIIQSERDQQKDSPSGKNTLVGRDQETCCTWQRS